MTPSELGVWDSDPRGRSAGLSTLVLRGLGVVCVESVCSRDLFCIFIWLCFVLFPRRQSSDVSDPSHIKEQGFLEPRSNTSTPLYFILMRCDVICPLHLFWVCEMRSKFTFSLLSSEAHFRTFCRILCLFYGRNTSCLIQASHFVSCLHGGLHRLFIGWKSRRYRSLYLYVPYPSPLASVYHSHCGCPGQKINTWAKLRWKLILNYSQGELSAARRRD